MTNDNLGHGLHLESESSPSNRYNIKKKLNILPAWAYVQKPYLWMEKLNI